MTDRVDIDRVLMQMRTLKAQAQKPVAIQVDRIPGDIHNTQTTKTGFGDMLSKAVDKVNATQKNSAALTKSFESGDPNVSITQVMVASEKASVSFQAMTQVRNKLVKAYEDILKMPI